MLHRLSRPLKKAAIYKLRCDHFARATRGIQSTNLKDASQQPLRILFCGSDDFSITSLKAVHRFSQSADSNVASIDVATKTDKRTGRGLKTVRSPSIKTVAKELGLAVHQFDTFRGWNLPTTSSGENYINMVIAVSFGLLVPPRILGACQYGGLNVHPSLLPDLKGSAPIEYSIIHGYDRTGVTVQTLHPSRFDEGQIVLQTPQPGFPIPKPDEITAPELRDLLAPVAANMLVQALDGRLFLQAQSVRSHGRDPCDLNFAPKMTSESRHPDFRSMETTQILRLNRALGSLWTRPGHLSNCGNDTRLIFGSDMRLADSGDLEGLPEATLAEIEPGLPFIVTSTEEPIEQTRAPLLIKTGDGGCIAIPEMKVSGMQMGRSATAAVKARLFAEARSIGDGNFMLSKFSHLLS